jgi:hypothetical protein
MRPRAAAEQLVERALVRLGPRPAKVADVGSGSGGIAVAIALAPDDGLGPYRRLLEASEEKLNDRGLLFSQFRRRVLEGTRFEHGSLLAGLEERALAA